MSNQHFRSAAEQTLLRRVENILLSQFCAQGYLEVDTPILETTRPVQDDAYRVLGQDNELLSLRPDFTSTIAAWSLTQSQAVQKYAYFGPIFRRSAVGAGGLQVMRQAGVESIGTPAPEADVEVVALAIDCLLVLGVTEPRMVLGQSDFSHHLFAEKSLDPLLQQRLLQALARRDLAAYQCLLSQAGPAAEPLRALPDLCGETTVLTEAQHLCRDAAKSMLTSLVETVEQLQRLGYGRFLYINLGLQSELNYYSGLLFEAYAPGAGSPVIQGGRYDALMQQLGGNRPAAGFAVLVEQLLPLMKGGY